MAGVNQPIPLADANVVVEFMVRAGRVPHPSKWVEEFRIEAEGEAMANAFGA